MMFIEKVRRRNLEDTKNRTKKITDIRPMSWLLDQGIIFCYLMLSSVVKEWSCYSCGRDTQVTIKLFGVWRIPVPTYIGQNLRRLNSYLASKRSEIETRKEEAEMIKEGKTYPCGLHPGEKKNHSVILKINHFFPIPDIYDWKSAYQVYCSWSDEDGEYSFFVLDIEDFKTKPWIQDGVKAVLEIEEFHIGKHHHFEVASAKKFEG